jgi:hypothetical protein
MAALFVIAFFGFAVWYVVNSIEDKTALTIVFCFIGFVAVSAVFLTVGVGVWYFRSLGTSIVQSQSQDAQAVQMAIVNMIAEQRKRDEMNVKRDEMNQQLLIAALTSKQLPAPAVTTGSGSFVLRDRGREVTHSTQPAQAVGWLYRLPDGRQVRGDLIEAIVDHQFDDYDSKKYPDFRTYLHEFIDFGHTTYRSALDALEREGVCDSRGTFKVDQDEAWRIVAMMQSRARVETATR